METGERHSGIDQGGVCQSSSKPMQASHTVPVLASGNYAQSAWIKQFWWTYSVGGIEVVMIYEHTKP
jgi:hypothetical protein